MTGVRTTDVAPSAVIDEIIGNRRNAGINSTVRQKVSEFAQQLVASGPIAERLAIRQGAGGLTFTLESELETELGYDANQRAELRAGVAADGIYLKLGASGGGSWSRIADLPEDTVEQAVSAGFYATELAGIAERRGWPLYPTLGEQAVPEGPARRLLFDRQSPAIRLNAKGLLSSVDADAPAHVYDNEGRYLGWLVEPERTNLALYSEEIDNAYWVKTRGTISAANVVIAPDGTLTAEKFEEDAQDGQHGFNTGSTIAVEVGDYVTASFHAKPAERDEVHVNFDGTEFSGAPSIRARLAGAGEVLSMGNAVTGGIVALPDGWYRIWVTGVVTTAGLTRALFGPSLNDDSGYPGALGSGFYPWGAQIEKGVNPTSYIKTAGAAATRSAVRSITPMNATAEKGTVLVRFRSPYENDGGSYIAGVYAGDNNRMHVGINSGNQIYLAHVASGVSYAIGGPQATPGEEFLAAVTWRSGVQHLAVNGVLYSDAPIPEIIAGAVDFTVGTMDGDSRAFNGIVREAYFFPQTHEPAELQALTTLNFSGEGPAPEDTLTAIQRRAWSGAVTDTSFRAFSDFATPGEAQIVVARNQDMWAPVFEGEAAPTYTTAGVIETYHSAMADVTGLQPDTLYHWGFRKDGELEHVRSLRTAPAKGAVKSFDFVAISCSNVSRETVHDNFLAITAEGASFVAHFGDMGYPDGGGIYTADLPRHRDEIARKFLTGVSVSRIFETMPIVYTADNHDKAFGGYWNKILDAGNGDLHQDVCAAAHQVVRETVPHYPFEQDRLGINNASPDTVTMTQRQTWGRVRILWPDLITQNNREAVDASQLGFDPAVSHWNQKQWLFDQIDEAEADPDIAMVILISSNVWQGLDLGSWEQYWPEEWAEVCDYIRDNLTKQMVVIAGDGHQGGADDGTFGDGSTSGKAQFPVFMSSGVYQSTAGSEWNVGPFSWDGADSEIKDVGEIYLYSVFRVIDNGGDDIGFEMVFKSAPIDPETKAATVRGSYRHDDAVRQVFFAQTPYAGTAGQPVTITIDKTWFGKCSVDWTADNGVGAGTIEFGANNNSVSFDVIAPAGGEDFTITLSNPQGCAIAGDVAAIVVVT